MCSKSLVKNRLYINGKTESLEARSEILSGKVNDGERDHPQRSIAPAIAARFGAAGVRREIEDDRALVAVQREEIGGVVAGERRAPPAGVVAGAGTLHLADVGAEVGE